MRAPVPGSFTVGLGAYRRAAVSSPAVRDDTAPGDRTLAGTARRIGAAAWWERRCFEVTGGWSATDPVASVAVHMASVSRHHAWRSDVLAARLPRLREVSVEELLAPPGAGAVAAVESLRAAVGSVERMALLQRVVLPRLSVLHAGELDRASEVADGALGRWLAKVADDVAQDWATGERELQALLASPGAATRAATAVSELDELLAVHPGSLPVAMPAPKPEP